MVNDLVADSLARIKNAIERKSDQVEILHSGLVEGVFRVMKEEGFIEDYSVDGDVILVNPAYNESGDPVVAHFNRISSAGQRMYLTSGKIVPIMNGRGISIISTSEGVMTGASAKSKGIGGEHICNIW